VALRRGDLFAPGADEAPFDVVVSNPPYVARGELTEAPPEVRDWEPRGALVAGPEGTEVIRRLVEGAPPLLRSGGLLALEIGAGQGDRVRRIVEDADSYRDSEVRRDLAGRERILLALRR
ncbi:MAG: peptide chain release factor N(5)-glutamine methyltransferase, partial [Gemmatimonadetes bacterium]|nr:peptide chain release factor N(5)-glutamine methyltransferase [Gemmatimonadota bacterium]NIR79803.1 peptide chain release factor N(5)-glutamine methyltransferase [Gemmatimonadota bacterium]NIT88019.1 peptide chain release factor N(5)-glutamine methyltransferase [Gemmatimonadota bacterium]NIU32329.1 peptide chain release factor N(5)-glutamine methyltransferase [Gemmatimonadota bacterium]NIU36848.1 peptide chain release factor N(5)-glutamine methyltransferase [Gemmatimonadota bacterium]